MELCTFDQSITRSPYVNQRPACSDDIRGRQRLVMWNCMRHMCDFCSDITCVTVAAPPAHEWRRTSAPVGDYAARNRALKRGVRSTIKEIKSSLCCLAKDKVAHYHRRQHRLTGGRTLFAAKIKLFQFIVDFRAPNLHQQRVSRGSFGWRYVSFDTATVCLVLGPPRASSGSPSGPLMPRRLLLTVRCRLPQ